MQKDSAEAFPEARRGLVRQYGAVTVAFEVINPSIKLVICGSGPDVVTLVEIGTQLGYDLTVVDHRPQEEAHQERFPGASVVECLNPVDLAKAVTLTPHTAAVTMSHNYARDLDYVRALIRSEVAYIGVLGPRARTERMLADIAAAGEAITRGERIYSPVGIDIGSDDPASIALSILAEVSAVVNERNAGHLRDRRGPLHQSGAEQVATEA
jgi:xanthine/CO dehydrogenase XdhC/CoxF family maturation factor